MKIKNILALAALLLAATLTAGAAGQVTLAWEASPDAASLTGYTVYAAPGTNVVFDATHTQATRQITVAPTVLTCTFTNLTPGTWCFVATAKAGALESDDSNQIEYTRLPTQPALLRVTASVP